MQALGTPLDELDASALYRLLGNAYCAQLTFRGGEAHDLGSSCEIGKREFETLVPMLREDLKQACRFGIVSGVTRTIERSATWRMPATVVAVLAIKENLAA